MATRLHARRSKAIVPGTRSRRSARQSRKSARGLPTASRLRVDLARFACLRPASSDDLREDSIIFVQLATGTGCTMTSGTRGEYPQGSPFALKLLERLKPALDSIVALKAEFVRCRSTLAACEAETTSLATRIARLEPAFRAKEKKRFWTPAFWANFFNGSLVHEMAMLREQQSAAERSRHRTLWL